jgi:hypothetical protein
MATFPEAILATAARTGNRPSVPKHHRAGITTLARDHGIHLTEGIDREVNQGRERFRAHLGPSLSAQVRSQPHPNEEHPQQGNYRACHEHERHDEAPTASTVDDITKALDQRCDRGINASDKSSYHAARPSRTVAGSEVTSRLGG